MLSQTKQVGSQTKPSFKPDEEVRLLFTTQGIPSSFQIKLLIRNKIQLNLADNFNWFQIGDGRTGFTGSR